MKALELKDQIGIDSLVFRERPIPAPGPDEVLVEVKSVSLNYRDLLVIKGQYYGRRPRSLVPGSDCAGKVVEVGENVKEVSTGDRVISVFAPRWQSGAPTETATEEILGGTLQGTLAEFVVLREDGVVPVPVHLSYEEAATLPCAAVTAWHALMENECLRPGDTVLIMGSGGVALFALQFAKLANARVVAISGSDEKLDRLKRLGLSAGSNYRTVPNWDEWAQGITNGIGVDHILELGGAGTLPKSLRAIRWGGHISLIGVLTGGDAAINPLPILMKNVRIQGIFVGSREMFKAMNHSISMHRLRPLIDQVFPFEETRSALRYMESGSHFGKLCIRI